MIGKSNMEDDSVLLKQRSDDIRKISRQNSKEENWRIFKEYYVWKTLIAVVVGGFILWEVINIAFFSQKSALSVMMMNVQVMMEQQEPFTNQTGQALGIDEKKEFVSVTSHFKTEMLVPLMAAGEVDVFLMDRAAFEEISESGYLINLNEMEGLPELEICFGKAEEDIEEQPYGLIVTDSAWLSQFGCMSKDDIILGFAGTSKHLEMSKKFTHLIK